MFNSDQRYIEKKLKDKYGVNFKVAYSKDYDSVTVKYWAYESGNKERKIIGIFDKEDDYVTDTYIDAKIANEIGEYLTDEM